MKEKLDIIENICIEIISELKKELQTRETSKEESRIRLWRDQDSAINILEKVTNIFIKIKQAAGKPKESDSEPLNETDIKIIMNFCQQYLSDKNLEDESKA